jgi:hypothetical protein
MSGKRYCEENWNLSSLAAEVRESSGRTKDDGQWFAQREPFHLYVYSAFFDYRSSLGSEPQVAIISVIEQEWLTRMLWCRIFYEGHGAEKRSSLVRGWLMPAGAGVLISDDAKLVENVIVCPLQSESCPPSSVALAWGDGSDEQTAFLVPVETVRRSAAIPPRDLAICVSVSYGNIDRTRLIEWLEMQRILGVDLVVVYNHSLSGPAAAVLRSYTDIPNETNRPSVTRVDRLRVEIRQSHDFLAPRLAAQSFLLHMSPVINDCMYRHHGLFRHFAVIDLDEVIVPRTGHHRLPDLLASLSTGRIGAFVFRNAYFFLDFQSAGDLFEKPGKRSETMLSVYETARRRLRPSPPQYSVKSIVDSDACVAMHNHYCWTFTTGFLHPQIRELAVPVNVALMHHYKRCHFDEYLDSAGTCRSIMRRAVYDDIMKKYAFELHDRLTTRYAELNVTVV